MWIWTGYKDAWLLGKSVCECQGSSEDYILYCDSFPKHAHFKRTYNDKLIVGNLGNIILRYASLFIQFLLVYLFFWKF